MLLCSTRLDCSPCSGLSMSTNAGQGRLAPEFQLGGAVESNVIILSDVMSVCTARDVEGAASVLLSIPHSLILADARNRLASLATIARRINR